MTMLAMGNPQERCDIYSIDNMIIGVLNFVDTCLTWLWIIIYSYNFAKTLGSKFEHSDFLLLRITFPLNLFT